jgi:hypothetical protein
MSRELAAVAEGLSQSRLPSARVPAARAGSIDPVIALREG